MYFIVTVIGVLVGLEIPLLMRIVRERFDFRDAVAHVLTFDYIGALAGFAAVSDHSGAPAGTGAVGHAVRHRSTSRVALWSTYLFAAQLGARRMLRGVSASRCWLILAGGMARGQTHHRRRRRQYLCRRNHLLPRYPLPAHRAHAIQRRSAAVPQQPPAIQLARRIPLSRIAGASRSGGDPRSAARAGAGRRRRAGACARSSSIRKSRASRWWISIRR